MRSAKTQWHTKTLGVTHYAISTKITGRGQQRQRHQIRSKTSFYIRRLTATHKISIILDTTFSIWILHQSTKERSISSKRFIIATHNLDADRLRASNQNINGLGEYTVIDKKAMRSTLLIQAVEHIHGLSSRSTLVQQRCIGQLHTGKIDHHGLVVQKGFQTTLTDFCLIWRVLGIPSWIFHDVTQNHSRCVVIIITHPDVILVHLVF